jgi:hypothetical protein
MPLWIFIFVLMAQDGPPTTLGNLAWVSLFAGLALAWCAVGALLLDIWRSTPRGRIGLFLPLVLLLSIPYSFLLAFWFGAIPDPLKPLVVSLFFFLLFVHPLISAVLLMYVSLEVHAFRQEAHTHSKLGFVVVSGMVLMLLGGLLLNLTIMHNRLPLPFLPACIAIVVALRTLFWLSRSRESTQARPKDASPTDVDSFGGPRGDWG